MPCTLCSTPHIWNPLVPPIALVIPKKEMIRKEEWCGIRQILDIEVHKYRLYTSTDHLHLYTTYILHTYIYIWLYMYTYTIGKFLKMWNPPKHYKVRVQWLGWPGVPPSWSSDVDQPQKRVTWRPANLMGNQLRNNHEKTGNTLCVLMFIHVYSCLSIWLF
jgi:hypothetical protein